jgi:hypothetical protein
MFKAMFQGHVQPFLCIKAFGLGHIVGGELDIGDEANTQGHLFRWGGGSLFFRWSWGLFGWRWSLLFG